MTSKSELLQAEEAKLAIFVKGWLLSKESAPLPSREGAGISQHLDEKPQIIHCSCSPSLELHILHRNWAPFASLFTRRALIFPFQIRRRARMAGSVME